MSLRLFLACCTFVCITPFTFANENHKKINELLISLNNYGFSGVAAIQEKGSSPSIAYVGLADANNNVPFNKHVMFDIASITKHITALAILQLETKGKLGLSDTLEQYIPDLPEHVSKIQIQQLLNHTSGLEKDPKRLKEKGYALGLMEALRRSNLEQQRVGKFTYSNLGYCTLGYLVEKISNTSLENYLEKNIFSTFSVSASLYNIDMEKNNNFSRLYTDIHDVESWVSPYSYTELPLYRCGASGAVMTVNNILLWTDALWGEGGRLTDLSKKLTNISKEAVSIDSNYANGIRVEETDLGLTYWHDGDTSAHEVKLVYLPDRKLTIFLFTNSRKGWRNIVYKAIENIILGKPTIALEKTFNCEVCEDRFSLDGITLSFDGAKGHGSVYSQEKVIELTNSGLTKQTASRLNSQAHKLAKSLIENNAKKLATLLPKEETSVQTRQAELLNKIGLIPKSFKVLGTTPWRQRVFQTHVEFSDDESIQIVRFVWHPKSNTLLFSGTSADNVLVEVPFVRITKNSARTIDTRVNQTKTVTWDSDGNFQSSVWRQLL